jgi:hypothetical protein
VLVTVIAGVSTALYSAPTFRVEPPKRSRPKITRVTRSTPLPQYTQQSYGMSLSYYNTRGELRTTLTLNNKGIGILSPRLTLYARDGRRHTFEDVAIAPRSFVEIDIKAKADAAGPGFEDGSLRVTYIGKPMEMGGLLRMTHLAAGIEWDEQLMYPNPLKSNRLVAVGWTPSPAAIARLAVTNTTGDIKEATVRIGDGANGEVLVALGPWQTEILDVPAPSAWHAADSGVHPSAKFGAISIDYTGQPGGVMARGFVAQSSHGYSGVIQFADPAQSKSKHTTAGGVRLAPIEGSELQPWIVAKNWSTATRTLTARLFVTETDRVTTISIGTRTLQPGEVAVLDARDAWSAGNAITAEPTSSLEFGHDGEPGDVQVAVASISEDRKHSFRAPLYDAAATPSAAGDYYFELDDYRKTIVSITNTTDLPQRFKVLIRHADGAWTPKIQKLLPRATAVLDVAAIRSGQLEDAKGRVIPVEVSRGQIHWSLMGGERKTLLGRVEQIDTEHGVSATYACPPATEDIFDAAEISPSWGYVEPGEDFSFGALERDRDGLTNDLGEWYDIGDSLTWHSSVPGVADLYSHTFWWGVPGQFLGKSGGEIQVHAEGPSNGFLYWNGEGEEPEGHEDLSLYADLQVPCYVFGGMQQTGTIKKQPTDNIQTMLEVPYKWYSSRSGSGVLNPNLNDIAACSVREWIEFSEWSLQGPYALGPNSPHNTNPWTSQGQVLRISSTLVAPGFNDVHDVAHQPPYTTNRPLYVSQRYEFMCPCWSQNWQTLLDLGSQAVTFNLTSIANGYRMHATKHGVTGTYDITGVEPDSVGGLMIRPTRPVPRR